ncbi:Unknown protein sequence [Pseudomonas coronafaciens pv. oryzae]|nr:Unknown protein sequence [Pseudomonas coronafaciens pv. oryzae]
MYAPEIRNIVFCRIGVSAGRVQQYDIRAECRSVRQGASASQHRYTGPL